MAGNDTPAPADDTVNRLINDGVGKPAAPAADAPDLSAYRTPGQPGNADKPGAAPVVADKQAGGAQPPPGDASVAAAAPPAKPVDAGAKPVDAAAKPADATDHSQDAAARAKALDVVHQVNAILDGDVPKLNKAHDMVGAQKAYEQAIALAKTLSDQDIAQAQKDLIQVRKDKAAETDPDKKRDLANKEVDLYTITRLKDAALGNMALWYYRQGKTDDGNAKLLEACGVDPAKAQQIKKLGKDELQAFGDILAHSPQVSPILGDVNFYRQLNKINQASGGQIPRVFGDLHDAVVKHNAEVNQKPGGDNHAGAPGSDAAAPAKSAAEIQADMKAYADTVKALGDKPGPITDAQRKALENGIAAYDAQNTYVGNAMDASQQALDSFLPKDKKAAFTAAAADIDTAIAKATDAKTGETSDAVQAGINGIAHATSAETFKAAVDTLNKTNPDMAAAINKTVATLPDASSGMHAVQLYLVNSDLQSTFVKTSLQQIAAHYNYAKILTGTKNPPDPADMAHAADVFQNGFKNVPKQVSEKVLTSPDVQALGKTLGLADKPAAGAAGDKPPGAAGATAPGDTGVTGLAVADLQSQLDAAVKAGPAGMTKAKALFEEEIRRAEDPARTKFFNDTLKANVTALESGRDDKGQALDANTRMALHKENVQLISALSTPADLHSEYAMYLGDQRLALDDATKMSAKIDGGLNQLKSMDAQQKLAIKAADSIDADLLKRADAQVNADRKANVGDSKALTQFKIQLEGGKDDQGNDQIGRLNMRVNLRDQLAALYLMQGKQFNAAGGLIPTEHHTDELFKPQDALKLLTEAKAANEVINGKGAHDDVTENLYAMGQSLQPEVFKNNADSLKKSSASVLSDAIAMASSVGGSTAIKFALAAATDGKINPMLANSLGNVGAIGTGILARRLADHALTGQWESWSDSAVHGTAAALLPIGFKYTAEFLGSNKAIAGALNYRTANITGEAVLARAGDASAAQLAEVFKGQGLTKEATLLEALGTKPVSSLTADEVAGLTKALNAVPGRPAAVLGAIQSGLERTSADAGLVRALDNSGVKTVGDLEKQLATTQERVFYLRTEVEGANLRGLSDKTSIEKAITDTAKAKGGLTAEDAAEEVRFLKANKINTVGELRAMSAPEAFSLEKMYPRLVGMAPETTISEAAATGNIFGDAASAGRVQLRNIVPTSALGPEVTPKALGIFGRMGSAVDGLPGKAKDLVWDNRFYRISMDGSPVTFPNMVKPPAAPLAGAADADLAAAQGGGLRSRIAGMADVSRLKPAFNNPFSLPNLERLDPAFATKEQLALASSQTKFYTAAGASLVGVGAYNTTSFTYDNWWKGTQYKDTKGEWHKYSFTDAVLAANFGQPGSGVTGVLSGTVGQALVGGWLLKGAVPAVLGAEAAAGPQSWLGRIPGLNSAAGREATAGSSTAIKAFGGYALFGNPNTYQGAMDHWINGPDAQTTADHINTPLTDAPVVDPNNVGTTADGVAAQTTGDGSTPVATGDGSAAAAPVNPNADVATGVAANQPADASTPVTAGQTPAAVPPVVPSTTNQVGGDQPPPGQ